MNTDRYLVCNQIFQKRTNSSDISQYLQFNESTTRSSNIKLCHNIYSNTITANSYFCRLPRLWNALPIIDLTLSISVIIDLNSYFYGIIDSNNYCTFHFSVLVTIVFSFPTVAILMYTIINLYITL